MHGKEIYRRARKDNEGVERGKNKVEWREGAQKRGEGKGQGGAAEAEKWKVKSEGKACKVEGGGPDAKEGRAM